MMQAGDPWRRFCAVRSRTSFAIAVVQLALFHSVSALRLMRIKTQEGQGGAFASNPEVLERYLPGRGNALMTGALSVSLGGEDAASARAARSLKDQGFAPGLRFAWNGGALQAWARPWQGARGEADAGTGVETAAGFACCVGPVWYRGRFGADALRLLLDEVPTPAHIDPMQLRGNFALFMRKHGRSWLMNDALGFARIYGSSDGRFYSTSWLATRAFGGSSEIDEAAAIEYVLQGAAHSERTVAASVGKLPLGHLVDLDARRASSRFPQDIWSGRHVLSAALGAPFRSIEHAVDAIAAHLKGVFGEIVSALPGRISAALSGGFDSRLILAGLLACGERPRLFVYGGSDSEDVPIARQVAGAKGLGLTIVDKDILNSQYPMPSIEELVNSALFFDGLPNDGILDAGADRLTRLEQTANARLALNGGGGEILRNFFRLPERGYRARDIVKTFYRGFDRGVFRNEIGLEKYEVGLAQSMLASLGVSEARDGGSAGASDPGPRLTRAQTELLYPLFRCHHWMGVNNSVSLRHGQFATPLVDLPMVLTAAQLPLSWKNAGQLQSRVIAAMHSGVARHPSAYGFDFCKGPGRRARLNEWGTARRPVFARPMINGLRRRLSGERVSPDLVARYRQLLPGEWRLDPVLHLNRLPDDCAFARALSVEVVARELAP